MTDQGAGLKPALLARNLGKGHNRGDINHERPIPTKPARMHDHHSHHHDHTHGISNLKLAFLINLAFVAIEVIGGFWTNSITVLSDAVHDFGDALSLGMAWYLANYAQRGPSATHTYGYRRYALLGGLFTGLVLIVGLGFVLWAAVSRLFEPQEVHAPGMLFLAILGIVFNGAAAIRVRRGSSLTEQIVSWHLIEDTLGWVAVLVGAGIMMIWDVPIVDPLLSIAIAVFILWNLRRNLAKVFQVFIQVAPRNFDVDAFEQAMQAYPKVLSLHHTHSWSIDGEVHVLTTHLVMERDSTRAQMVAAKQQVRDLLDQHTFEHVTVDIELEGEQCVSIDDASEIAAEHAHQHGQHQGHS